jgi:uncharacterized membrane protein
MVPLTFDGAESWVIDVTDSGIVLGMYLRPGATGSGFFWTATGGLVDLGLLPGSSICQPFDVNNAGVAVGSRDVGNGVRRPFIWRAGTGMEDIGGLVPSSEAAAVNDAGHVFGRRMADGTSHAVRWTAEGVIVDLPEPDGVSGSEVLAVNNAGVAIGQLYNLHAFAWSETLGMVDLATLPGGEGWAFVAHHITSEGLVHGRNFSFDPPFLERAFIWSPTTGVATLPDESRIFDSNREYAVGAGRSAGTFRAFMWSIADGFVDIGLSSGFEDSEASAVNGLGLVAGVERRFDGALLFQPFIWTATHGRVNFGGLGAASHVAAINDAGVMGGYRIQPDGTGRATIWTVSYSTPPQPNEAPTPAGSNVEIELLATLPGAAVPSPVLMAFANVTTAGTTTVETSTSGPPLPEGFKLGEPPVYFDVETTAVFSGAVALCFSWQEGQLANEANARLLHFEDGAWLDVTTTLDIHGNRVCGEVTSLSPFVVAEAAYTFGGFEQPLLADGSASVHQTGGGRTIPVKFSVTRFAEPVVNATATIAVYRVLDPATGTLDPTNLIGDTGNLFRHTGAGKFVYNLSTKGWISPATYRIVVTLSDGSEHTVDFSLR